MAKKKVVKKKVEDPWAGASHGTPGFGVGSTPVLQQLAAKYNTPAPDPNAAAKAQYGTLVQGATNSADRQYGYTLSDSIGGEGSTALDLGATLNARPAGTDPATSTTGYFDWNGVEATNPFSKAALLVRNYKQQQNRTTNGLAAQGQLYSGAMLNQQGQDSFGFQSGQDSLYKALQGYLTGQAATRRNASVTRDDTINNAGLAGLQSLIGS